MLFKSVEEEEFLKKVKIRFNSISKGFDEYFNGVLQVNGESNSQEGESRMLEFLLKLLELNGEEYAYIDFYYSRLQPSDREKLKELLEEEDRATLKSCEKELQGEGIYFKLSKSNLPLIVRLCTKEILFSTFYFTKIPCTIWGNYEMKFPCFFQREEDMKLYKEISKNYDLQIL